MIKLSNGNLDCLVKTMQSVFQGENDEIANLSNASAVLFNAVPNLNWAGFYRFVNGDLVLGPFQGKPACVRIANGKGVCGTVAKTLKPLVVENVHNFQGHIACDSESNSEMVVPLFRKSGEFFGVLDLDSPLFNRFEEIAPTILLVAKEIEKILL